MCEGNQRSSSHTVDWKSGSSNFTALEILLRNSAVPRHDFWDRYEDRKWVCGYGCRGAEKHIFQAEENIFHTSCMYCHCVSGYGKGWILYSLKVYHPQKFQFCIVRQSVVRQKNYLWYYRICSISPVSSLLMQWTHDTLKASSTICFSNPNKKLGPIFGNFVQSFGL